VPSEADKAAAAAARDHALTVACPECKAAAMARCIGAYGRATNIVHRARVDAWKAAGQPVQDMLPMEIPGA
jgi:hypothetical protein